MDRTQHWQHVYATKPLTDVSWYQPHPARSLELIGGSGAGLEAPIIDVGGGDALLVDALLDRGHTQLSVLDVSRAALDRARHRLGTGAAAVTWIEADVTQVVLPAAAFAVWHDRAVFHFLTTADDRARYVATATTAIQPGGTLIVATFALDGPARCSGLDVARYSPQQLAAEFAAGFRLERGFADVHVTPTRAEQRFSFAVMTRLSA